MNFKRIYCLTLLLIVAALFTAVPASAQDEWTAYLFNSNTAQIVQVGPQGKQAAYWLGVNPEAGEYVSGFDMAVTPDGGRAAFCFVSNVIAADGTPVDTKATYVLRDIVAEQDIVRLDLGRAQGCRAGSTAFNADATRLALAIVYSYPIDPKADPNQPFWAVQMVDPLTGAVQAELNQRSPQLAAAGIDPMLAANPILPLVVHVDDTGLIFTAAMFASEGRLDTAFRWDFAADSLSLVETWGKYGLSRQTATGEFAYADFDPSLPVGEPGGPMANNNIVRVRDASGADKTVLIGGSDWVVVNTLFVNEGRDLLIHLLESFVPSNGPQDPQKIRWALLGRDGSLTDIYVGTDYTAVAAAGSSYLLLAQDFHRDQPNTFPSFTLTITERTDQRLIWQWPPATSYENWEIMWVTPASMQADLPPFTPVD